MIRTNQYIGSPVERIEDLRFLRGRGQFVGDLKRENMLHAAILRSPVAHGLVAAVDTSAALSILGARPSNSDDERMMHSTGKNCRIAPA